MVGGPAAAKVLEQRMWRARPNPATVVLDALGSPRNVNIGSLSFSHSPAEHNGLEFADLCPPSTRR
jgi:hypothetical protein